MAELIPPRLSVVVNNYNYGRFLKEALDSAIAQLHDEDELIVVDDGSTDESLAVLKAYEERKQIRLLSQENQGQLNTVRNGVLAASGDVVLLLDSDDYYLPGYLDRLRKIYTENNDIDFVFSAARVAGENAQGVQKNGNNLGRMELQPGRIGTTRWSTQLFHEFVGVPTSGNSLRTDLARKIATLPGSLENVRKFSPLLVTLLGIPEREVRTPRPTADGVLVRASSLLGANKYYDDRPAFVYRIHGDNQFAATSRLARYYLRSRRMNYLIAVMIDHFGLTQRPDAVELRNEVLGRSYGLRLWRRFRIRANYLRAIPISTGTVPEKAAALKAVIFNR